MAESLLDSFLTCPVCLETFTEPLTLSCNHSFCRSCLQQCWRHLDTRTCPVCRRASSGDLPSVNFALHELSEQFRQKLKLSTPQQAEQTKGRLRSVCPSHPHVPPLYCLDHVKALCPLCEFSLHPQHKVVKAECAEAILKEQIMSQLKTVMEQRQACEWLMKDFEEIQGYTEEQGRSCERQIRTMFSRLQRFLQEEEEQALSALRDELSRQAQSLDLQLQSLMERLASLDRHIQALEKQLNSEDIIYSYSPKPMPRVASGFAFKMTLDPASILGNLSFRTWRRMRKVVEYSPVILNPNTASPQLRVSDDLRAVRYEDLKLQLPDNPQRFTFFDSVVGARGFSCGSHQWEVEVGDHQNWFIGVSKESVDRKAECQHLPKSGHWCLSHYDGKYFDIFSRGLTLQRRPERIRVQLDMDKGQLTFSDAQHETIIYSHSGTFTDEMFPYFSVGRAGNAKTKELRICQQVI